MLEGQKLHRALEDVLQRSFGGITLKRVRPFGVDEGDDEAIRKAVGYGRPLLLEAEDQAQRPCRFVFHTAGSNPFGHDRRSDRAREMLLAYDTFHTIPLHTRALDVGAIDEGEAKLISLKAAGEFYLLTSYAPGHIYAEELSHAAQGRVGERDRRHAQRLAEYLAKLHARPRHDKVAYTRSIRDLVGGGEGIFGIIDGYPGNISPELKSRLESIEQACCRWRWRLKHRTECIRTIHGDFHPYNIVFDDEDSLALLDTSRGSIGDPADDVSCLSINYVFFALTHEGAWQKGFSLLWFDFWKTYFELSGNYDIVERLAPFFAWRILVLASPAWYSGLNENTRALLLDFAETILTADRFEPAMAQALFD